MQKWEYAELSWNGVAKLDHKWAWNDTKQENRGDRLNEMGRQGWELITTYSYAGWTEGQTSSINYVFKRLIE